LIPSIDLIKLIFGMTKLAFVLEKLLTWEFFVEEIEAGRVLFKLFKAGLS